MPRVRRGTDDGGCAGAAGGGAAGVGARRAGGQWRCRSCSSASSSVRVRFPFRAVLLSMSLVGNVCMSSLCMLLSAAAVALLRLQRAALGAFGSGATRGGGSAECLVRRAACVRCWCGVSCVAGSARARLAVARATGVGCSGRVVMRDAVADASSARAHAGGVAKPCCRCGAGASLLRLVHWLFFCGAGSEFAFRARRFPPGGASDGDVGVRNLARPAQ